MESKKTQYDIAILNNRFSVKSELSESQISQLVQLVETRIRDAQNKSKSMSLQGASIMTALGFAAELFETQQKFNRLMAETEADVLKIHEILERAEKNIEPIVSAHDEDIKTATT